MSTYTRRCHTHMTTPKVAQKQKRRVPKGDEILPRRKTIWTASESLQHGHSDKRASLKAREECTKNETYSLPAARSVRPKSSRLCSPIAELNHCSEKKTNPQCHRACWRRKGTPYEVASKPRNTHKDWPWKNLEPTTYVKIKIFNACLPRDKIIANTFLQCRQGCYTTWCLFRFSPEATSLHTV